MSSKEDETHTPLKIIFLPFPEAGHIIPMADIAKTISFHGVECNIITTPANASYFQTSGNPNTNIIIHTLTFPALDVGLPSGIENFSSVTSPSDMPKVAQALSLLRKPTEDLVRDISPDCLVSDTFFPWTSYLADEIQVPRVIRISSPFTHSCAAIVMLHAMQEQLVNDEDTITLPFFPQNIVMKKSQLPNWVRVPNEYTRVKESISESNLKSFGALTNTFPCDVEEHAEIFKTLTGLKVWNIGPVCLQVNRSEETHTHTHTHTPNNKASSGDSWTACREWLDQKKPKSVLYVSFGSITRFPDDQLREIAAGLELSGHDFIWVVRKKKKKSSNEDTDEEWSVEEFRKKMEESNTGFIIQDWAPQVLILKHQAIGGMVTHCGWNTILEGVTTAGVPLVTWPLFAEQFYNERLLVDVLKIGVPVGANVWYNVNEIGTKETLRSEKVEAAVRAVMGDGEGAVEMRERARELCEGAKRAVEKDGSSQANLKAFFDELKAKRISKSGVNNNNTNQKK